MLHDGLAGTEGAGDGSRAALGDREELIDDTLTGVHGTAGDVLLLIGSCDTDGPALDHAELVLCALRVFHDGDGLLNGELAALDADDLAGDAVRDHDLMQDRARLLDGAEHVARAHLIAGLCDGDELPLLLAVERGNVDTSRDAVT